MKRRILYNNLMTLKYNMQRLTKGFTLMEVTVVVVLVAIIAAFAIPGYDKTIRRSHERSAVLALTSLHSANEIYEVKRNEFLPGGGLNLSQINSGLKINIKPQGMTYSYTRSAPNAYTATAAWTCTTNFTVRVNQGLISTGSNPCCSGGTCPTLPGC